MAAAPSSSVKRDEIGRCLLHCLEGGDQAARRGAAGPEIDAIAWLDCRKRLARVNQLRAQVG